MGSVGLGFLGSLKERSISNHYYWHIGLGPKLTSLLYNENSDCARPEEKIYREAIQITSPLSPALLSPARKGSLLALGVCFFSKVYRGGPWTPWCALFEVVSSESRESMHRRARRDALFSTNCYATWLLLPSLTSFFSSPLRGPLPFTIRLPAFVAHFFSPVTFPPVFVPMSPLVIIEFFQWLLQNYNSSIIHL